MFRVTFGRRIPTASYDSAVILWLYYFMRASWITPGQGQMHRACMKLSISALSCSGYRVGGVLVFLVVCYHLLVMVKTVFRYSVGNVTIFIFGMAFTDSAILEEFVKLQPIACRHSY